MHHHLMNLVIVAQAAQPHGPFGSTTFYFTGKEMEYLLFAVVAAIILTMLGVLRKN